MHKFSASVSAVALAAFFASPALSADLKGDPTAADYTAPDRVNWTGLWLGALGGYQINTNEISYHDHDDKGSKSNDWKAGIDGLGSQGFMGELAIGFDKQLGDNFFVGVFAGANLDNSEWKAGLSSQNTPASPLYDYSAEVSFEKEWGGVLGGRLGFIHGKTSFVAGAGWAFGEMSKVHGSATAFGHAESGDLFKDQDTDLSGWFIQGDIEHSLGGGLFAVGTARYTDYGSMTLYSESDGKDSVRLELDRDEIAALAGLKYKFGFGN
jgi:hypothetical protein